MWLDVWYVDDISIYVHLKLIVIVTVTPEFIPVVPRHNKGLMTVTIYHRSLCSAFQIGLHRFNNIMEEVDL